MHVVKRYTIANRLGKHILMPFVKDAKVFESLDLHVLFLILAYKQHRREAVSHRLPIIKVGLTDLYYVHVEPLLCGVTDGGYCPCPVVVGCLDARHCVPVREVSRSAETRASPHHGAVLFNSSHRYCSHSGNMIETVNYVRL